MYSRSLLKRAQKSTLLHFKGVTSQKSSESLPYDVHTKPVLEQAALAWGSFPHSSTSLLTKLSPQLRAVSTSSLFSPHQGGRAQEKNVCVANTLYVYNDLTGFFSWRARLMFCSAAFCRGNKIAYCGANSITLESPYHFLLSGDSEHEAPWCRDHHQLTVAGEFEIKGGVLLWEAGWRRSNWIVCCLLLFSLLTGCAAVMESSYYMVKESFHFLCFSSLPL